MRGKSGCGPGLNAGSAMVAGAVEMLNEEIKVRVMVIVTEILCCFGFNRQVKTNRGKRSPILANSFLVERSRA
jgi:hypothetical protein